MSLVWPDQGVLGIIIKPSQTERFVSSEPMTKPKFGRPIPSGTLASYFSQNLPEDLNRRSHCGKAGAFMLEFERYVFVWRCKARMQLGRFVYRSELRCPSWNQ